MAVVVSVDATDARNPIVRIKAGKRLQRERTLDEMRAAKIFQGSILFRQFRLSVVPLTEEQYDWLTRG
jgi:predicted RNA-binding protein with PUA-like domain